MMDANRCQEQPIRIEGHKQCWVRWLVSFEMQPRCEHIALCYIAAIWILWAKKSDKTRKFQGISFFFSHIEHIYYFVSIPSLTMSSNTSYFKASTLNNLGGKAFFESFPTPFSIQDCPHQRLVIDGSTWSVDEGTDSYGSVSYTHLTLPTKA